MTESKREPLVSAEEIEHEADTTIDRGLRAYIDVVTTGGDANQADLEWTAHTLEFVHRIGSLVRKHLAERLRERAKGYTRRISAYPDFALARQDECEEAARIVEGDQMTPVDNEKECRYDNRPDADGKCSICRKFRSDCNLFRCQPGEQHNPNCRLAGSR